MAVTFGLVSARRHGLDLTEQDAVVRAFSRPPGRMARRPRAPDGILAADLVAGAVLLVGRSCLCRAGRRDRAMVDRAPGPAWTPAQAVAPFPAMNTPPIRYRTSALAGPVAVLGLLPVATRWLYRAGGGGDRAQPRPSPPAPSWVPGGRSKDTACSPKGPRRTRRSTHGPAMPPTAADRATAAALTAIAQWLGVAPATGSLTMVALGWPRPWPARRWPPALAASNSAPAGCFSAPPRCPGGLGLQ